jgi:hypothetical protein
MSVILKAFKNRPMEIYFKVRFLLSPGNVAPPSQENRTKELAQCVYYVIDFCRPR